MFNQYFYKNYKWLCLSTLLALLDIFIKYYVRINILEGEILYIFPGFNLCFVQNPGFAFGLFSNVSACYQWILICIVVLTIFFLFMILCKFVRYYLTYFKLSYSIILGGALGNLYDRIFYGMVLDFIDLHIGIWHWPVFNVADIEIFIGLLMLIVRNYFLEKNKKLL